MPPSFRRAKRYAHFIGLFLFAGLLGLADDPVSASDATDDAAANLRKSVAGYGVGDPARYADLFGPLRTQRAALSSDGKHFAYTVRQGKRLYAQVLALDAPQVLKATVALRDLSDVSLQHIDWDFDSQLVDWFGWVTNQRLVLGGIGTPANRGMVIAFNADGSDVRQLASAFSFTEITFARASGGHDLRIVGLNPEQGDSIILASSTSSLRGARGSDHPQLKVAYAMNVFTGKTTRLSEMLVGDNARVLRDPWGRSRITAPGEWYKSPALRPPLLYLTTDKLEDAVPLDNLVGVPGFDFAHSTIFGESSLPLGFDVQGDVLYYASNVGQDKHAIYAFDLKTRQRLSGTLAVPAFDILSPQLGTFTGTEYYNYDRDSIANWTFGRLWRASPQLVWDRFTKKLAGVRYEGAVRTALWLRPELQAVQDWLAANRPGLSAEILEWDESLNRFLIQEQGPADAGSFFILDQARNTYTNIVRRRAAPETGSVARLTPFAFTLPDGSKLDGHLALPRDAKIKRIPLVLLCPDFPWERRGTGYQQEFEALTRMGFAVAIYNGRGVWGTGRKERQKLQGDYVATQVADLVSVADYLAEKFPVSRRSVALYGQRHGGYVALRALQLQPDRFRAAVTVEAWTQRSESLDALVQAQALPASFKTRRWLPSPVSEEPGLIKAPVFTIVEFSESPHYHANTALHRAVKKNAPKSELFVQTDKYEERPETLARQWARTESFLNYVLYNFSVRLGATEFLPDEASPAKPAEPKR